jgi:hypothetical protein
MALMLSQLMSESFFDSLRTKEQLGYVVYVSSSYKAGSDVCVARVLTPTALTFAVSSTCPSWCKAARRQHT